MGNFPPFEEDATTTIQSQPNSREAEEAVLGSVLINPDSYFEISQVIKINLKKLNNRENVTLNVSLERQLFFSLLLQ